MKSIWKRLALGFLTMALFLSGLMIPAGASIPPTYAFGTWTGSGDISVRVPYSNADKFLRLVYDRELIYDKEQVEISPTNYTVTADGNDTIVTLKEEYLQTLADGTYNFTCYFSGQGEEFEMFGERAYSTDPFGIELPNITANYTLKRISYNGEDLDHSLYTVTTDKGYPKIVFKEGISIDTSFMCYFTAEYVTEWTSLQVDRQALPPAEETTTAPPAVSSEAPASAAQAVSDTPPSSSQPASSGEATTSAPPAVSALSGGGAPESGNASTGSGLSDALAAGALLLLPVSAVCCAILLKRGKKKNTL